MAIRRRLIVAALYIGSLAVVAVVSVYYGRNFTGMGPTPERAAFGRRLVGTPDGDAHRFQFFYATNRALQQDDNPFTDHGRVISDVISTGTFDVRITEQLPIRPWIWNDADAMSVVDRTAMPVDETLARLKAAIEASPNRSLLVIVWGFRDRFQTAALRTAYTAYVLDINTPVLLFDWPGNQGEGSSGYRASREMSYQSGPALGQVLSRVIRETSDTRIWLMGSSLGCQTICEAFSWMMNDPNLADTDQEIEHVILNAPDVSAQEFDERFAGEIKALSKHLTSYVASNDRALLVSKFVNRSRRLGRPNVAQPAVQEYAVDPLDYAADLLALQDQGVDEISVVDVTPINRTRNLHHFFTDSPEYFDDLYRHLLEPSEPVARRLYSVRSDGGSKFWIIWGD